MRQLNYNLFPFTRMASQDLEDECMSYSGLNRDLDRSVPSIKTVI